jgi:hypothetical protein
MQIRMNKKALLIVISITLLIVIIGAWQYWRIRDQIYQWKYEITDQYLKIESKVQLLEILNGFETIKFSSLSNEYKESTGSEEQPFKGMLSSKSYYLIKGEDIYQKIVGNYRIKDFLPKDRHYKNHVLSINQSNGVYWLINVNLLYKFLELQENLRSKGYNDEGFVIVNGYRPPNYNKAVGGASQSRHIVGEAVDILIKDVNLDGIPTLNEIATKVLN